MNDGEFLGQVFAGEFVEDAQELVSEHIIYLILETIALWPLLFLFYYFYYSSSW